MDARLDNGVPLGVMKYQVHENKIRLNYLVSMVAILMKRVEEDGEEFSINSANDNQLDYAVKLLSG